MQLSEIDLRDYVLETERLTLRPFEETDLNDLFEYASVAGVGEAAGWKHHESLAESACILKMFIGEHRTFAVVLKETGKVIGSVGIEQSPPLYREMFPDWNMNELGYVLSKEHWGKGLMSEAIAEVIRFAFERLNLDAITCGHFVQNARSKRVIEKNGFVFYREDKYVTQCNTEERCLYYYLTKFAWKNGTKNTYC